MKGTVVDITPNHIYIYLTKVKAPFEIQKEGKLFCLLTPTGELDLANRPSSDYCRLADLYSFI